MPVDFDLDQIPDVVPETPEELEEPEQVPAVKAETKPAQVPKKKRQVQVQAPALEIADELEYRMIKSQYYWEILKTPILPDADDEVAQGIEAEIYTFVRGKLEELMGGGGSPLKTPVSVNPATAAAVGKRKRSAQTQTTSVSRFKSTGAVRTKKPEVSQASTDSNPESTSTGEDIIQIVTDPRGFEMRRTYRQFQDTASGRQYYLCLVGGEGKEVGDGNKYEMAMNESGGQYFRVISEQTLPDSRSRPAVTNEAFTAASQLHASKTVDSISRGTGFLGGLVAHALKQT